MLMVDALMNIRKCLSPGIVLELAVLGVLSERARTAAEVIAIVKRLGGAHFQPTSEVIAGRL